MEKIGGWAMRFSWVFLFLFLTGCFPNEIHHLPGVNVEVALDCNGYDGFWLPGNDQKSSYICTTNSVDVLIHEFHHELLYRAGLDPKFVPHKETISEKSCRACWFKARQAESP
ncbi:MAG: hypothetical protein C0616_09225 [Desulfuromonas sp.]|nr:MAG: hypothetical protein C0616_09225 [Desulfuromonas sp.]